MDTAEMEKLLDEAMPGPWRVDPSNEEHVIAADDGDWDDNWSVATATGNCGHGPIRTVGNARLIALAPTLARKVIAAEKLVEALQVARDNEDIEGMFFALAAWEAAQ